VRLKNNSIVLRVIKNLNVSVS